MTDEQESVAEDLCGERLKQAREDLSIPLATISKELHLDEAKVEALERNEFEILGAPVFAKGHLRKYAEMVKVDIDQILFDYHQLTRADGLPPVVSDRKRPSMPKSPTPWIISGVAVLLIVAAWFAWQFYMTRSADAVTPAVTSTPAPAMQSVTLPAPTPDEQPVLQQVQPVVASTPVVQTDEAVDSSAVSLQLTFTGDCWTEVTDASGDRLFFNLGTDGDQINVAGDAPVSVLLGNAGNVSLVVNGQEYAIANADRNGDTARFTLYGS